MVQISEKLSKSIRAVCELILLIIIAIAAYSWMGTTHYKPGETARGDLPVVLHVVGSSPPSYKLIKLDSFAETLAADPSLSPMLPESEGSFSVPPRKGTTPEKVSFQVHSLDKGQRVFVKYHEEDYNTEAQYVTNGSILQPEKYFTGHGMSMLLAAIIGLVGALLGAAVLSSVLPHLFRFMGLDNRSQQQTEKTADSVMSFDDDIKIINNKKYASMKNEGGEALCLGCRKVDALKNLYYCKETDEYCHKECNITSKESPVKLNPVSQGPFINKRIITFITISALLIILIYWAASKLDTFGTGLIAFIPICYFIAKGLKSLIQMIRRREVRTNLLIGLGSFIATVAMLHAVYVVSDRGLRDLTLHRKQTLNAFRPTLLKYKGERGFFPHKLQDLVPDYLQVVPPELHNDGKEDWYKKITYEYDKRTGEATFIFFQMRGPDSRVTYHVSENRYEYDK